MSTTAFEPPLRPSHWPIKVARNTVDPRGVTETLLPHRAQDVGADAITGDTAVRARRGRTAAWALTVMILAFAVYLASPVRLETDSFWVVYTARSLVAHQDADLDEYHQIIRRGTGFQVESHNGHSYYEAPLATSLAAVPFVAVASMFEGDALDHRLADGHAQPLDGIIAAALAAVTTGVMFLVLNRLTRRRWIALVCTGTFALGTQVWSTASRTMWMHGPSLLCLALALLLALRVRRAGEWCAALGATLALAYFVRPTNVVPLLVIGAWMCWNGRRQALRFASGAASVVAVFAVLNVVLYGRLLQPYFRASRIGVSATTVEALLGNLVSPARGLFVFVPVSLVCGYGFLLKRQAGTLSSLDLAVAASAVGYWLLVSTFPSWWAGWSYGPRFLTDIAPMLIWFLPPVLESIADRRRVALAALVVAVLAFSVAVQARGALDQSTAEWNWKPTDVGIDRARLWDWTDPQFLR